MEITRELAEVLGGVDRPGDFFAFGRAEFLAPRIEIEGAGPIAFPVLPLQAKQLISVASRAPYGRGPDTITDTSVRRTWQIDAGRISIGGKHWERTLECIVGRAAEGLGVAGDVSAELYKLLIYDKGSFFVSHRDTEKAPGMFATLVLALPSQSDGGELVVRHKGREARLDLGCHDPSEIAYAAFYADCVHEVLPVTSGHRVTLVFNLVRKAEDAAPSPPDYETQTETVGHLLRRWAEAKESESGDAENAGDAANALPEKLILPLEHAYTPAELAFDRLKGADAAVARLLSAAAPQAGCDLHLALLTIEESGAAEYDGSDHWHYRRGAGEGENSNAFDVVEVFEWSRTLSDWRRPGGEAQVPWTLPVEDEEVSPPGALEDLEPDEAHFHEATGNEGASFERTYRRAALVIWPAGRVLAVLNQGGLDATLPYLEKLIGKWQAADAGTKPEFRQQAEELALHMVASWPGGQWHDWQRAEAGHAGRMLRLIARLGSAALAERMIDVIVSRHGHDRSDNPAILEALALFSSTGAAGLLQKLIAANVERAPGSCAALLAGAVLSQFANAPNQLGEAARSLLRRMPGNPAAASGDQSNPPRGSKPDAEFVVDLADAFDRIDRSAASQAAEMILGSPRHFGADDVLVPAAKKLILSAPRKEPVFAAVLAAAIAHLETRIDEPLEAPTDWTRRGTLDCTCEHCRELAAFLGNATEASWTLRAAQHVRSHVESEIRRAGADVDTETLRRGSPHSLICHKNQASYERRAAQRTKDRADLATLRR